MLTLRKLFTAAPLGLEAVFLLFSESEVAGGLKDTHVTTSLTGGSLTSRIQFADVDDATHGSTGTYVNLVCISRT